VTKMRFHPDSNGSLATFKPVSGRGREFRREKVSRGQRPGRQLWRHRQILGDRDRAIRRLRRQSRGKSKTIPARPGNRSCAGLRGGAGRTRTSKQIVMNSYLDVRISGRPEHLLLTRPSDRCVEQLGDTRAFAWRCPPWTWPDDPGHVAHGLSRRLAGALPPRRRGRARGTGS
jgi:hypothetical protein